MTVRPRSISGLPEIVDSDGGQAVRLGGSGMVDCGAVADFDREDPYSLGAWFKPRGDGSQDPDGDAGSGGSRIRHGVRLATSSAISCRSGRGARSRSPRAPHFPMTSWHHVVCTYDGSSRSSGFKIYVDGVRIAFRCLARQPDYFGEKSRLFSDRLSSRDRTITTATSTMCSSIGERSRAEEARAWFTRGRNPSPDTLGGPTSETSIGLWTFRREGRGGVSRSERERPSRPARRAFRPLGDRRSGPDARGAVSRHRRHRLRARRRLRADRRVFGRRLVLLGRRPACRP